MLLSEGNPFDRELDVRTELPQARLKPAWDLNAGRVVVPEVVNVARAAANLPFVPHVLCGRM
jgi:hypothetical protein